MSLLAFIIILFLLACMRAGTSWQKQSGGGFLFVWLYFAVSMILLTPIAMFMLIKDGTALGLPELLFIAGSVVIHLIYSLSLQYGYKIGDLSLIYPVARGTGPLLVAVSAMFIFNEVLTVFSFTGIMLIVISIFILSGGLLIIKKNIFGSLSFMVCISAV